MSCEYDEQYDTVDGYTIGDITHESIDGDDLDDCDTCDSGYFGHGQE